MMLGQMQEHEPITSQEWDPELARRAICTIVADAEAAERDGGWPGHPLDDLREDQLLCSLYLGGAGMIWALSKLGSSLDCHRAVAVAAALERYRTAPDLDEEAHAPSLLVSETGVLMVADRLGSPAADRDRLSELVRANREHSTWELLWGSPGTILAARACGLGDEWRESAQLLHGHWDESLRLHVVTGDPVWLDRARRFAMHAIEQVDRERAARGRGRYALFTGDVGVALYLRACLDAAPEFPILETL